MFDILSGIGSLINPASAIASTVLGELFGQQQEQQAQPQVLYPQAPPQQVVMQPPPPPPVNPLVATGYFSNMDSSAYTPAYSYAGGGLVNAPPGPLSQFLTAGAGPLQGVDGKELPAFHATNPGFEPLAAGINQWLSGDLSFISPQGYAEGGRVQGEIPDEEIVQQAMAAIAGVAPNSDEIIQEFTNRFGEQALMDLASKARGMGNMAPPSPQDYEYSNMRNNPDPTSQPRSGSFGYFPGDGMTYGDSGGDITLGTQRKPQGSFGMIKALPGTAVQEMGGVPGIDYRQQQGDGLSDSVPAMINGSTPAALSDGEFVMPADVVSGLGNGSTTAGAQRLMEMIENVRKARTGKKAAPPKIKVER